MVYDSRKRSAIGTMPTPQDFRAQATGIGSTILASRNTGAARAQRVANSCDPQCAKRLPDGYPTPMPELCPPDQNGGDDRRDRRVYDQQRYTHQPAQ